MDWIVQQLFKLPPVLENLEDEKVRMSNPALSFLRQLALAVDRQGHLSQPLTASDLAEVATSVEPQIPIPGLHGSKDPEAPRKAVGMALSQAFSDKQLIPVDRFVVARSVERVSRAAGGGGAYGVRFYTFEPAEPPVPGAVSAVTASTGSTISLAAEADQLKPK
jgi:hypothetical protein